MSCTLLMLLTLACLTVIACAAPPSLSLAKDCAEIGDVAQAFAAIRDIGTTLDRALAMVKNTSNEPPVPKEGVVELFNTIIRKVYANPKMTPDELGIAVKKECLKSQGTMSAPWR